MKPSLISLSTWQQSGPLKQRRGFTLIELIMTILMLAVISVGLASYIRNTTDIYVDVVGRQKVIAEARFVVERMTRELREALPNSVRAGRSGNVTCVEFIPVVASSTYVNVPVAPESASNTVRLVEHGVSGASADKISVYALSPNQIYTDVANQVSGRVFSLNDAVNNGTGVQDVSLVNSVRFEKDSPNDRYYLIANAVSYCTDSGSNQIVRYSDYWPCSPSVPNACSQQFPPSASSVQGTLRHSLMATNQTNHDLGASAPFAFSGATLVRHAVVMLNLEFLREAERIQFHHEVHIVNVP